MSERKFCDQNLVNNSTIPSSLTGPFCFVKCYWCFHCIVFKIYWNFDMNANRANIKELFGPEKLSALSRNGKPASRLSAALLRRGGKRKESLQLPLWNLNPTSNSPVATRRLSCQISANQCEAETSANVKKHWKARNNDVINNVISANQHFTSTFSIQIFNIKFL